jgi:hypothetical protein
MTAAIRYWYRQLVVPLVRDPLTRQRLKLVYLLWGYWPILRLPWPWRGRLSLVWRFLRVDWHIEHAHYPAEIARLCQTLASRPARPGEVIVEAGCWRGGSAAKLSVLAERLGYRLRLYDSFEGVETITTGADEWAVFSGQYAASEDVVRETLDRFGAPRVCTITRGWFNHTLAEPIPDPIRLAYIDCDLAKATKEALAGIVPSLVEDGWIFTQDYHIAPVRRVLADPTTWVDFGRGVPSIELLGEFLAVMCFERSSPVGTRGASTRKIPIRSVHGR